MAILNIPVVIDGVKSIEELANRVLDEYEYNGRTIREWADRIAHPKTNGDRLRSMADEELTETIKCPYPWETCIHLNEDYPCSKCKLDWLKQEVK